MRCAFSQVQRGQSGGRGQQIRRGRWVGRGRTQVAEGMAHQPQEPLPVLDEVLGPQRADRHLKPFDLLLLDVLGLQGASECGVAATPDGERTAHGRAKGGAAAPAHEHATIW